LSSLLRISDPVAAIAVAGAGIASVVIDLQTRRIPNALTFGLAAFGMAAAALRLDALTATEALLGCAVGLALMLPGHVIGATGAGDVKLFAAIGTLLGPRAMVSAFLYTAIAGGALAIVISLQRRLLRETVGRAFALVRTAGANVGDIERAAVNRFAYAPAIAIGSLAAALGL